MNIISNRTWTRKGFSLLWDVQALFSIAEPSGVISMRQFFSMPGQWPDDLPAAEGDALIVAGLEGCLDILSEKDAVLWMETDLKHCILSFQDEYEGDAALIFWLPGGKYRIIPNIAAQTYHWKCTAPDRDRHLPIGRNLWAGAENEVYRILQSQENNPDPDGPAWAGLYHPRVS